MVRKQQLAQLDRIKQAEIPKSTGTTAKLIDCAKTGKGNLLEIAVDAKKPNYTRRNQRCLRNCLWKIQSTN
jgi:methylmalonyl-CoA mutase